MLWVKCTENIKAKIKYSTKYQNMEDDEKFINLQNYQQKTLKYKYQLYPYELFVNTHCILYNVKQGNLVDIN